MNALGINEVDNDVLSDADQYLREHKILELFEVSDNSDSLCQSEGECLICLGMGRSICLL